MTDDTTLGGYWHRHGRPPSFQGSDGCAYSADAFVDAFPDDGGRYGAALLFMAWSQAGDRIVGHLETPYLLFADTPDAASAAIRALTLHQVKQELDLAVRANAARQVRQ